MSEAKRISDENLRCASFEDLCEHFECFDGHWAEAAEEARRILSYDNFEIESDSFYDNVIASVAQRSRDGAFEAVAAALGVSSIRLQEVVTDWYEARSGGWETPGPVGFDGLRELVENPDVSDARERARIDKCAKDRAARMSDSD